MFTKSQNKKRLIKSGHNYILLSVLSMALCIVLSSFYQPTWSFNWQEIRPEIRDSVLVAQNHSISSGIVGFHGYTPKQFNRRHWIMKEAHIKELELLLYYPNGTIQAIAYEGLLRKRNYSDKYALMQKALAAREYEVLYQMGCEAETISICGYLLFYVFELNRWDNRSFKAQHSFGLKPKEIRELSTTYWQSIDLKE